MAIPFPIYAMQVSNVFHLLVVEWYIERQWTFKIWEKMIILLLIAGYFVHRSLQFVTFLLFLCTEISYVINLQLKIRDIRPMGSVFQDVYTMPP